MNDKYTINDGELYFAHIRVLCNVKSYAQCTVDDGGRPFMYHYELEGADFISYTCDEYPELEASTLDRMAKLLEDRLWKDPELRAIAKRWKSGELSDDSDESWAEGFWDFAGEHTGSEEQQEQLYNQLKKVMEVE